MKISASAVKLGFEDDFSDSRDSVFVNSFSVTSSLCAQKMSASAVELGFLDDFWVPGSKFLSTVSKPAVVYVH
jgi:ethanolamine utilization microcompartment shell protein EutS